MKSSRRAKRMARHHGRNKKPAGLNLVSLMDIFTIMVFFLMMNQSDVQVMSSDSIKLPASQSEVQPKNTINLLVSQDDIVVQGRAVASMSDVLSMQEEQEIIPALKEELEYLASRSPATSLEQELGRTITIMGDQGIPYKALKRIMTTCQKAQYTQISLAVKKQVKQEA
ncbi:ExbD/TolR family protein [Bermanella sp. R86510]|uniref:ExbD/TolR family protein n=1 Tax=unclassified Bermanella TaxID=2627862 RepID=UPI0037C6DD3E